MSTKFWFGSLEEIVEEGVNEGKVIGASLIPRKGFKEPADKYPTRRDFGEWCWAQCENEGYDRQGGQYQLRITGPIEISENVIDKAKRTLDKKGKTL